MKITGTYNRLDLNGDGVVDIEDLTLAIRLAKDIADHIGDVTENPPVPATVEIKIG